MYQVYYAIHGEEHFNAISNYIHYFSCLLKLIINDKQTLKYFSNET
jgi:hypothetical protein